MRGGHINGDTVPLHAPTAYRRYEETKKRSCRYMSTAAGLRGNWERENHRSKPHGIECGLDRRFPRSQTREARGGGRACRCPAGAVAPAGLLVYLPASILNLRFFDDYLRAVQA